MTRGLLACGIGLSLVSACSLGETTSCNFAFEAVHDHPIELDSIGFRVRSEPGAADQVSGGYEGSVINRSTEAACAFAIYEFDEAPEPDAILPVVVGEAPPEAHPGGGRLIHHGVLPAAGDHTFEVSLVPRDTWRNQLGGWEESELDTTIVLALCEDSEVELDLTIDLFLCAEGEDGPAVPPDAVRQLW